MTVPPAGPWSPRHVSGPPLEVPGPTPSSRSRGRELRPRETPQQAPGGREEVNGCVPGQDFCQDPGELYVSRLNCVRGSEAGVLGGSSGSRLERQLPSHVRDACGSLPRGWVAARLTLSRLNWAGGTQSLPGWQPPAPVPLTRRGSSLGEAAAAGSELKVLLTFSPPPTRTSHLPARRSCASTRN